MEQKYCKKIIPLVSQHHLLLVTLLLSNAAAMESLPIFLDRLVPSYLAIILSVTMILFFGEVIPQAICSRYGLAIGYYIHWLMWFLIAVCAIIAWPVAKLLDCILGEDQLNFYRPAELQELVRLHRLEDQSKRGGTEGPQLNEDEVRIIQSALTMREKVCDETVYTPLEKVWALPTTTILDHETIKKIHLSGHSRIPVYRKKKTHFIGLILVKDLIVINPEDKVPLDHLDFVMLPQVTSLTPLYDLLNHFRSGSCHMAVVLDSADFTNVLGIVTLEDIIEELLAVEIYDEQDLRINREALPRPSLTYGREAIPRPSLTYGREAIPRPSLTFTREAISRTSLHLPREEIPIRKTKRQQSTSPRRNERSRDRSRSEKKKNKEKEKEKDKERDDHEVVVNLENHHPPSDTTESSSEEKS